MKDVKLICEHGHPHGIRAWTGFLFFSKPKDKEQQDLLQKRRIRSQALDRWWWTGKIDSLYEAGILHDCCQCCTARIQKEVEKAVKNEIEKRLSNSPKRE